MVIEPNLDPKDATLSRTIPDQPEEDYLATGHAALIAQAEGCAAEDPGIASYPGTLRAADPRAMHRCATALVTVSLRETFIGLNMPRTYVFGVQSLPHPHEELLRAGGVPMVVVLDAGHDMLITNPVGVAHAIAETLASSAPGTRLPAERPPPRRRPAVSRHPPTATRRIVLWGVGGPTHDHHRHLAVMLAADVMGVRSRGSRRKRVASSRPDERRRAAKRLRS